MDRLAMRGGRYIPAGVHASDADRVRALENFISQYSEESGYVLDVLEEEITALQERVAALSSAAVVVSSGEVPS